MPLNVASIRRQFPFLTSHDGATPSVYLDSAATTQKPKAVLDAMQHFYEHDCGNVHRGMHRQTERATDAYEAARIAVQHFINAAQSEEIIFTKNCTEALNLVAHSWGRTFLKSGDTVALSILEHHSNIVPWLQLKEERNIDIRWLDLDNVDLSGVKLVSITGLSNVLGTAPDLPAIIAAAHRAGALVCIDAAQMVGHFPIDVQALDCDFLAFSGHKLYGPTGIGVLYCKRKLLESMPPFLGGGMMIRDVTQESFTAANIPARFEAGTPPIAEAVGLSAAIDWLTEFPWNDRTQHEQKLLATALTALQSIDGLTILGPDNPKDVRGCISFVLDGVHPHDLTELLGERGFSLRAGHHCAQPLHEHIGIAASTRLSVGIYNTEEEITSLASAIKECMVRLRSP